MGSLYTGALVGTHTVKLCRETGIYQSSWKRVGNGVKLWEPELVEYVHDVLAQYPAPVLVDVGAGPGSFALLPALLPSLQVVAIEANPVVVDTLIRNCTLNRILHAVQVFDVAVSDYSGQGVLNVPIMASQSGMAVLNPRTQPRAGESRAKTVAVTTIDAIMQLHTQLAPVHVIKMDIEGQEIKALQGARDTITRDRPVLVLECYHPNLSMHNLSEQDVYDYLTDIGYTWSHINAQNIAAVPA